MDIKKEHLRASKVCRFCLTQDGSLSSIYNKSLMAKNAVTLPLQIMSCVSVEVFPSDGMPSLICQRCRYFMDICHQFKQICRSADESIMQFVQDGEALEPIIWPSKLVKAFQLANRPANKHEELQAIVPESACVQVSTSQDRSDSDEDDDDDEGVYNIKIETDGTAASPKKGSARIKVVAGAEKLHITKENSKPSKKNKPGFTSGSTLAKHVRAHAPSLRPFPCKFCEKTFIKSHHYTRHLRLKHKQSERTPRAPFGVCEQYPCEQCDDSFMTQDELIYHSAIHATQNLICPLCQEKFEDVDAVTIHIKSHVEGEQFMCELCELVFTTKQRLDDHMQSEHEEEMRMEQELESEEYSMEMEGEEDDEDNKISVKEDDGEMIVEVRKPSEFLLPNMMDDSVTLEKINTYNSESETEATYTNMSTVDTIALINQQNSTTNGNASKQAVQIQQTPAKQSPVKQAPNVTSGGILRKAEEVKRKAVQQLTESPTKVPEKSQERMENTNSASDKSLRLLEKELKELQRTSNRTEVKSITKSTETIRNRRPQFNTSTPKPKSADERKLASSNKFISEKKLDRRPAALKENNEAKDFKDAKNNNNVKEDKEIREKKEERDNSKPIVKNSGKSSGDENIRRSSRPSKIKDYAKMIRDSSRVSSDDDTEDDDEEYVEIEKTPEMKKRPKNRTVKIIRKPSPVPSPTEPPRKRGRPRKEKKEENMTIPNKVEKSASIEDKVTSIDKLATEKKKPASESNTPVAESNTPAQENADKSPRSPVSNLDWSVENANAHAQKSSESVVLSPLGQTLKKVPVKALPPGVKPLSLLGNTRSLGSGELCEMQIGKKMVKVQKIIMSKAEVEAMAKKGLVEMKDGTMVLKQRIKLPATGDPKAIKPPMSTNEAPKEDSSPKKDTLAATSAPTRCELDEEA